MIMRAAALRAGSWLVNQVAGGRKKIPVNDPTETRRDSMKATRKANTAHKQAQGAGISKDPRAVATPFPLGLK